MKQTKFMKCFLAMVAFLMMSSSIQTYAAKPDYYMKLNDLIKQSSIKEHEAAFDNNIETKWCVDVSEENQEVTLEWTMEQAVKLDAYAFVTADDLWKQDPQSWTLYGTNDRNGEWTELSDVKKAELPKDRKETSEIYNVKGSEDYKYFKLVITGNRGNLMQHYQFSDLLLLEATGEDGLSQYSQTSNIENVWLVVISAVTVVFAAGVIVLLIRRKRTNKSEQL